MSTIVLSAIAGLGSGLIIMISSELLRRGGDKRRDRARERAAAQQKLSEAIDRKLDAIEAKTDDNRERIAGLEGILRYFHTELRDPVTRERAARIGNGEG